MLKVLKWATIGSGLTAAWGTLASFTRSDHWSLRIWDYPRVQIGTVAGLASATYGALFFRHRNRDYAFIAGTLLSALVQFRKIYVYTPLAPVQVKAGRETLGDGNRLRVLIANVLMENKEHRRILDLIDREEPDLILLVETDHEWDRALAELTDEYPHVVRQPQSNYYGLLLFSKLPLHEPRLEFLVQDDIPSVHATVELPSGVKVALHGLHPRPPQPTQDQNTTPRDAELVIVGREVGERRDRPTLVIGDLNDVAWSHTSELFMRVSGLLDPRVGRGLYNSFNANIPLLRWPLDHVFHSNHFRLMDLRRLPHIGSDHFPVLADLIYDPSAQADQPEPQSGQEDWRESSEMLEKEADAARRGEDRPTGRG